MVDALNDLKDHNLQRAVFFRDRFELTFNSADASTAQQLKAAIAEKKIYIFTMIVSVGADMTVTIQDEDDTAVMEPVNLSATGGFVGEWPSYAPLSLDVNKALEVITSAAGAVSVTITGAVSREV